MTVSPTASQWEPITEHVHEWRTDELRIDPQTRLVQNLVLCGAVSRNGHRYTVEALRAAASLYDHKPVFLDHAANTARPYVRSTRDLVGMVQNAHYSDERIMGDIQVLETEAGRTFLALLAAENSPVGMSHVVLAQRDAQSQRVEKIHDVVSVDAVVFPATTRGWRESTETAWPGSWEAVVEQIDTLLPEHLRELEPQMEHCYRRVALFGTSLIIEQVSTDGSASQWRELAWSLGPQGVVLGEELRRIDPDSITACESIVQIREQLLLARDEVQALRSRLDQQLAADQLDTLLATADLPDYAITAAFRQQLLATTDAQRRRQLIAERRQLIDRAARSVVASRARQTTGKPVDLDFVRAVRGVRRGVLCGQA